MPSLTGRQAREFTQIKAWLNSSPLTISGLKGKVVLLDFWTFGCVNCVRTLPYVKQLYEKFGAEKFTLVGVHTPEFAFERPVEAVADAVKRFQIRYPIAVDSENATWKLYGNQYWPRQTLVDALGKVRWEHVGEGAYGTMESNVAELLKESTKVHAVI